MMAKPTLTLCMIVRDVALYIGACLRTIAPVCREVIIVDTGSLDDTKNTVRKLCAEILAPGSALKILDFNVETHPDAFMLDDQSLASIYGAPGPFSGEPLLCDFSRARQFGWDAATSDFVIWVDSDDLVINSEKLPDVLERMNKEHWDHAMLPYHYGHDAQGRPNCILSRERIVRRAANSKPRWEMPIHEVITNIGPGGFCDDVYISHQRSKVVQQPKFPHRNLKVLLKQHAAQVDQAGEGNVDPRVSFYLGMEWRYTDPERALPHFRQYLKKSGWDEERALTHLWLGQIAEAKGDYESAFLHYAASHADFPWHPDGLYGCARVAYFKQHWEKCVEFTERGDKVMAQEHERKSVLQHNPLDRLYQPLRFVSKALIECGRVKDGLQAARKALTFNPDDKEMLQNVKVCEEWLANQDVEGKPQKIGMQLNEPLGGPVRDLPHHLTIAFAVHLWKMAKAEGNFVKAMNLIESMPTDVRRSSKIQEAADITAKLLESPSSQPDTIAATLSVPRITTSSTPTQPLKIVIWTGPAWEKWSPQSIVQGGIGGSETAAASIALELARLGHKVTVYLDTHETSPAVHLVDGAEFAPYHIAQSNPSLLDCDVFISSRQAWVMELPFTAKLRLLWVHDIHVGGNTEQLKFQLSKCDKILTLSKWHKNFFREMYPFLSADKIIVTRNGINAKAYQQEPVKRGSKLIYSSSANRGLDVALDMMPMIRAEVPDAELHVYYGFDTWRAFATKHAPSELKEISHLENRIREVEGVVYHGRVGQEELAKAQLESKVWFYPTDFTETSCISAMEAQAAGCVPVSTAKGALPETIHHGILIKGTNKMADYQSLYVQEVVRLLKDDDYRERIAIAARREALRHHPWSNVAREWQAMFESLLDPKKPGSDHNDPPPPETACHVIEVSTAFPQPLRLAFVYGRYSSSIHGPFDIPAIYERQGLTGSESSFFNMVKAVSELGHQVDVFCDTHAQYAATRELAGAHVYPLWTPIGVDYDAYVSWNEPDLLRDVPSGKYRVCFQQLNDFRNYSKEGWNDFVDLYVFPSDTHRHYVCNLEKINLEKAIVIPNSINLDMYQGEHARDQSLVWCSSPDRGLHVLLEMWPEIKARMPKAILKIFYRYEPWYNAVKDSPETSGQRARRIHAQLESLGRHGESGVVMYDAVSNRRIADELMRSRAFIYTCEPIQFTEGFSVSTMDACAAGCPAIISSADALPEIYKESTLMMDGLPSRNMHDWIQNIADMLTNDEMAAHYGDRGRALAKRHDRKIVANKFLGVLSERLKK